MTDHETEEVLKETIQLTQTNNTEKSLINLIKIAALATNEKKKIYSNKNAIEICETMYSFSTNIEENELKTKNPEEIFEKFSQEYSSKTS